MMRVADCSYNVEQILALMKRAESEGVALIVFPEMCLTGYTCPISFITTRSYAGPSKRWPI